jgi:hypothetical protein
MFADGSELGIGRYVGDVVFACPNSPGAGATRQYAINGLGGITRDEWVEREVVYINIKVKGYTDDDKGATSYLSLSRSPGFLYWISNNESVSPPRSCPGPGFYV